MIIFNKTLITRCAETYQLDIDEQVRTELTNDINELIVDPAEKIDLLTEQDIQDVLYKVENPKLGKKFLKYWGHSDSTEGEITSVAEKLYDWLEDMVWENITNSEFIENESSNNEIYVVKD